MTLPIFHFITKTRTLTRRQTEEISHLLSFCHGFDGTEAGGISFPLEDEDSFYFLFYSGENSTVSAGTMALSGVLALSGIGEGTFECTAFVLPEARRRGIARALFDCAQEYLKKSNPKRPLVIDLIFDEASGKKESVARALGADFLSRELHMKLSLKEISKTLSSCAFFEEARNREGYRILRSRTSKNQYLLYFRDQKIGSYSLWEGGQSLWLYEFRIYEKHRGKGHGSGVFPGILKEIQKEYGEKKEAVSLQVTGDNLPAVSIYKKYGFSVESALAYYRKCVPQAGKGILQGR